MKPPRRFRSFRDKAPLQETSRRNLPLRRLAQKQQLLSRFEKRLKDLQGLIERRRAFLKEFMEEDTPYRINGRFKDITPFIDSRDREEASDARSVKSPKPRKPRR